MWLKKAMVCLFATSSLFTMLGSPVTVRADSDPEKTQWKTSQEDVLTVRSWEAALTDADGTHGAVIIAFYRDGQFRITVWARDPETGNHQKIASKTGSWQLEVHSQWTSILHVTVDGQSERNYLEIFQGRKIGLTNFPLSENARLLFINRAAREDEPGTR